MDGKLAVDFLGRTEALDEDLAELLDILNSRPDVPKLNMPQPGVRHQVNFNAGPCDGPGQAPAQHRHSSYSTTGESTAKPRMQRLPPEDWTPRSGTVNLCDKNEMFRGQYQHCYAAFASFYGEDMRLLHGLSPPAYLQKA